MPQYAVRLSAGSRAGRESSAITILAFCSTQGLAAARLCGHSDFANGCGEKLGALSEGVLTGSSWLRDSLPGLTHFNIPSQF
ncbi:hypothetical protein SKAU_G00311020 [Synaphobranchus kaupii]|uniref:Uncharacterized protein n=1 Tax=Synaphobranchus kaupii TaxID=118154 RepID=A0A9Q1ERV2_SYNKA|nr:hypothetical protein SKAU_G00311020 [Synaphobranchus kaupii]